jgi:transglutaminase-like putative cysteine protease
VTRYLIRHSTIYSYDQPMASSQMVAYQIPRATPAQTVEHSSLWCQPPADHSYTRIDVFGNLATYLSIDNPHDRLEISAESTVDTMPGSLPPDHLWEAVRDRLSADTTPDGQLARWCRLDSVHITASTDLLAFARPSFPLGGGLIDGLRSLSNRIFNEFTFDANATDVSTPLTEVLQMRRGVCQDFAHLIIGCLRSLGLSARYVSGYLETEPMPGEPKLVGADASHAWCGVRIPSFGWVDVDPTNDMLSPNRHVTVAWGRDYHDVAPVRGVTFGPPSHEMLSVSVDVMRLA